MNNQRSSLKRFLINSIARHQTWSFVTILASILICVMVIWLNFRQNQLLNQATDALENLHLARIELAKGFLYVTLSTKPDAPYSREEGLILLNQAVTSFEAIATNLDIVLTDADVTAFQQDVDNFQIQLVEYQTADTSTPALETELRIAFHNLENQANELDNQAHQQLDELRARINVQFALVLSSAIILLAVISMASIQSERAKARLDKALKESESRYRLIAENAADVIWVMDPVAGKFTYVSPSVEKLRGYTPEEVMAQPVSESLTPESLKVVSEGLARNLPAFMARGSGTESYINEVDQPCKDGSIVKTEVITTYLFNAQGQVEIVGVSRDITKRKQAEERLRDLEVQLQKLNDNISNGYTYQIDFGVQGELRKFLYISAGVEKLMNISPAQVIDSWEAFTEFFLPDDNQRVAELEREAFATMTPFTAEVRFKHREGRVGWLLLHSTPHKMANNHIVWDGMALDITGRKQAEEQMLIALTKYKTLFDTFPLGITVTDSAGNILETNSVAEELLGLSKEEQEHRHIDGAEWHIIRPDGAPMPAKEFASVRALQEQQKVENVEMGIVKPDGEVTWINVTATPLPLEGYGVVVTYSDITIRKKIDKALQETEYKYRTLVEQSPVVVYISDSDPQSGPSWLYISPQIERLLGYSPDVYKADPSLWINGIHPEDAARIFQEAAENERNGVPIKLEYRLRTRDGHMVWVYDEAYEVLDPVSGKVVLHGIFYDITERKRMEDELRRSNAELEQFAYIASHDLQEPLRTVAGMVQLLQQRYKNQLDERANEYIHFAVDASERMQQLIQDLLDFSRVERKGTPFKATNMEQVLQMALANLRAAIAESGAQITSDPLPTVMADSGQLTRVLQNLIGNAIKFRGEEPSKVHISAEKIEKGWQFAVRDNGIGIDPQYFDRVFLIFQRLHTRSKYPGTGIGLALCKKIIERHGGKMWIESKLKQGATFFFTIPERSSL